MSTAKPQTPPPKLRSSAVAYPDLYPVTLARISGDKQVILGVVEKDFCLPDLKDAVWEKGSCVIRFSRPAEPGDADSVSPNPGANGERRFLDGSFFYTEVCISREAAHALFSLLLRELEPALFDELGGVAARLDESPETHT